MADCGCVYTSGDGELPEFSTTDTVKARRAHKCSECGDAIPIGATYERVSGKWDGDVSTFKTCQACAEIRGLLFCDGWTYGLMWEDVNEYFANGGNPMGCIKNLETVAAKEKLAEAFRVYLDLDL